MGKRSPIYGVGINDVEDKISTTVNGKRVYDPYYSAWKNVLTRCYSKVEHARRPSYIGCTVCDEWIYFSNFKEWMMQQDWKGKQLDKDLLVGGNKVYSPQTCLFIPQSVNLNLCIKERSRGKYPLGCHYDKDRERYCAQGSDGKGKALNLGRYHTVLEAHRAWQFNRVEVLDKIKDSQPDFLVKIGLQRIIDKIQDDYENSRETKDFA